MLNFKSKIFGLLIGVIVIAGLFGTYYLGKTQSAKPVAQNSSPTSYPQPSSIISPSPEVITESFYTIYLNCIENHFQNSNGKSPKENCPFQSSNLSNELVQKLNKAVGPDPILCAQNTPLSIKVDKAVIDGSKASVTVHAFFESNSDNPIKIELTKGSANIWQINNISCSF